VTYSKRQAGNKEGPQKSST